MFKLKISAIRSFSNKALRGFTLIEIVLVLAIAALLFIIILTAVVGAQRSRRDFHRKNDVAALAASGINWSAAHNNDVADDAAKLADVQANYFKNRNDPSLQVPYDVVFRNVGAPHTEIPLDVGIIYYQQGHWCNRGPESQPDDPSDPIAGNDIQITKFVVWARLETGGIACADNY